MMTLLSRQPDLKKNEERENFGWFMMLGLLESATYVSVGGIKQMA